MPGAVPAFAQEKSSSDREAALSVYQAAMQSAKEGNYLAALRVLDSATPSKEPGKPALQAKSWLLNAVGRYSEGQQAMTDSGALSRAPFTEPTAAEMQKTNQVPLAAVEDLVREAFATHRVVILNEEHHQPEGRALGASLVRRLPALGVKYFALETGLQKPLDDAARSGKITTGTDPYSWDPQRAALLRAVLASGLKPIAIDVHPEESVQMAKAAAGRLEFRETCMARHLLKILEKDPDGKILVWVGFSHARKTSEGKNRTRWMAARFWKESGVEPYCIYQLSDAGDLAFQDPIYRLAVVAARRELKGPTAIRLPVASFAEAMPATVLDHPLYTQIATLGVDAVVLHPRKAETSATNRPAWLARGKGAEIAGRVISGRAENSGYLVQALPVGTGDGLTPVDQVVTARDGAYVLRLPAGKYQFRVATLPDGADHDQVVATVPAATFVAGQKSRRDFKVGRDR
jgi:hypothetical protein